VEIRSPAATPAPKLSGIAAVFESPTRAQAVAPLPCPINDETRACGFSTSVIGAAFEPFSESNLVAVQPDYRARNTRPPVLGMLSFAVAGEYPSVCRGGFASRSLPRIYQNWCSA